MDTAPPQTAVRTPSGGGSGPARQEHWTWKASDSTGAKMRPEPLDQIDLVDSYRRLTAIYHDLLSHEDIEQLLERIADSIVQLVPCDSLLVAELDPAAGVLVPILARGRWSDSVLELRPRLGEGLIGWAAANARPCPRERRERRSPGGTCRRNTGLGAGGDHLGAAGRARSRPRRDQHVSRSGGQRLLRATSSSWHSGSVTPRRWRS